MAQATEFATSSGKNANRLRSDLGKEYGAVGPRLQTRDAFALVVCRVGELRGFQEHEARFGKQSAPQLNERRRISFDCAANEVTHLP